jgi:hypothetical protein
MKICRYCPYNFFSVEVGLYFCTGQHGFSSAPLNESDLDITPDWCPLKQEVSNAG